METSKETAGLVREMLASWKRIEEETERNAPNMPEGPLQPGRYRFKSEWHVVVLHDGRRFQSKGCNLAELEASTVLRRESQRRADVWTREMLAREWNRPIMY